MKIFVVALGQENRAGEQCYVLGAFSTNEKAEAAIGRSQDKDFWSIYERDLDIAAPDEKTRD